MANLTRSDKHAIAGLLSSPNFLKLADSIIATLDRKDIAKLIAAYLYFKSMRRSDLDLVRYIVLEFPQVLLMALRIGISVVIPAMLTDNAFRTLVVKFAESSLSRSSKS